MHSISGHRWFVTFIGGFSRYTWLYLLKHKSDVFYVFKDLYALIKNKFGNSVKILRSDNGPEYVNQEFEHFLVSNCIEHQTTCVNTPEQNGVAERKNRHLLEVARSLMFTMNVPKFLWGEAVKTATYLINRMPLRVLDNKTPAELLLNSNDFTVAPKVFGYVCFIHDYRNDVRKLDPRAIKYVFVGYSPTQKGYRCWCPSERRFFVSMDVIFREYEPYYESTNDIGITLSSPDVQQEGESSSGGIHTSSILVSPLGDSYENDSVHSKGEGINDDSEGEGNNPCHGDNHGDIQNIVPSHDRESLMHEDPGTNSHSLDLIDPFSTLEQEDNQLSTQLPPENDLPIALRKPLDLPMFHHILKIMLVTNMTFPTLFLTKVVAHPSRVSSPLLIL